MLIHPNFDPVALSIGPLSIHWYGLMYLLAFLQFWLLGRYRIRTHPSLIAQNWRVDTLDDFLFYGVLGVILGGRIGEVLFYQPAFYFAHPIEIFSIWKGGMSFHGGLLGVLVSMIFCARKMHRRWFEMTDFIAPLIPLGLAFGRIGNFINGELWGRIADPHLPWAMTFPRIDALPRHPSQIYQALMEGVALFILLWFYAKKPRPYRAVSGFFLVGYGTFRFIAEFFRTPDDGVFGTSDVVSMGQWLSLPMIFIGACLFFYAYRQKSAQSFLSHRRSS